MAEKRTVSIDLTGKSPVASSDKFQIATDNRASERVTDSVTTQAGVALDCMQLTLTLDEFAEEPIELQVDGGQVSVAQLGFDVVVNGRRLTDCRAQVQFRIALPTRNFSVGDNQIELARTPLVVNNLAVALPGGEATQQSTDEGLPFGLTKPDVGNREL